MFQDFPSSCVPSRAFSPGHPSPLSSLQGLFHPTPITHQWKWRAEKCFWWTVSRVFWLIDHIFFSPKRRASSEFSAGCISRSYGNEISRMASFFILVWLLPQKITFAFPVSVSQSLPVPIFRALRFPSVSTPEHPILIPHPVNHQLLLPEGWAERSGISVEHCQASAQKCIWQCLTGCVFSPQL